MPRSIKKEYPHVFIGTICQHSRKLMDNIISEFKKLKDIKKLVIQALEKKFE